MSTRSPLRVQASGLRAVALLLLLGGMPVGAQTWNIHTYTASDGVPQTRIEDVVQGPDGRIWFATGGGAVAFDGVEWVTESVEEGLPIRAIQRITVDADGGIWTLSAGPYPTVAVRRDGVWEVVPPFLPWHRGEHLNALEVDARTGTTWVAATTHGLLLWDGARWSQIRRPEDSFLDANALAIHDRTLYVGTERGLWSLALDRRDEGLVRVAQVPEVPIHGVAFDGDTAWLIGSASLLRLDLSDGTFEDVRSIPGPYAEKPLERITVDDRGVVYFGNDGFLFSDDRRNGLQELGKRNGLAGRGTTGLLSDREGNVWITTNRGISKLVSRTFTSWTSEHGLFRDEVTAVLLRPDGEVVLGHNGGLTRLPSLETISFDTVRGYGRVIDLEETPDGVIWIAADAQGLGRLEPDGTLTWFQPESGPTAPHAVHALDDGTLLTATETGLFRVRAGGRFEWIDLGPQVGDTPGLRWIERARDGTILIATVSDGLVRLDLSTGEVRVWQHEDYENRNSFTVHERPDGTIWVGTRAGLRVAGPDGTLDPPPAPLDFDAAVYSIGDFGELGIWLGTDRGVRVWDGTRLRSFGARDGLVGLEANRDALALDADGHVWIGTDQGVSVFRPEYDRPTTVPPLLSGLGLRVDGRPLPASGPVTIEGTDSLEVTFRAISFRDEENVRFQVRLHGLDEEWSPWRRIPQRLLRYPQLPPGEYRVEIRAESVDGARSEVLASPPIVVRGPLWSRPWFVVLAALAGALVAWLANTALVQRRHAVRLEVQVAERTKELERSRAVLAAERGRLAATLASTTDAIATTDREGRVVLWNHSAELLTGRSTLDVLGSPVGEAMGIGTTVVVEPLLAAIAAGRAAELLAELGGDRAGASWRISCAPLRVDGDDGAAGAVVAFRDVTERRAAEQESVRVERLEALGTLAGGIAHDFNNYLTVVLGTLDMLDEDPRVPEELRALVGRSWSATDRARTLATQLLTFARGGEPHRRPIALGPTIEGTVDLALSGGNVRADVSIDSDLWPVLADEGQIASVLHNLLLNARRAMAGGGTVKITAENLPGDGDGATGGVRGGTAPSVELTVTDEGEGIAAEDLARIFDPYFSREEGGTGLGLAVAHSIVTRHGGRIVAESPPGGGARIRIVLPALDPAKLPVEGLPRPIAAPSRSTDASAPARSATSRGRILVLDDHEAVRDTLVLLLGALGHDATGCADGAVAVDLHRAAGEAGEPYTAAILDLTIPGGMGGREVARRILERDPDARLIATSGYSTDPVVGDDRGGFRAFLAKPFTRAAVARALDDAGIARGPAAPVPPRDPSESSAAKSSECSEDPDRSDEEWLGL